MVGMDAAVVLAALASAVPAPPPPAPEPPRPVASKAPARTVGGAVRRAHLTGAITWAERVKFEADLTKAKRATRTLPAARSSEVQGVLRIARRLARRGKLGGERLVTVMTAVNATTYVMRTRPFPAPKARLMLPRDGLVYEFRPGSGVQPHALGTAGRLNALAGACLHDRREAKCRPAAVRRTADAMLRVGVRDGDELRMEYVFPFGGGDAGFTSSMAQATAAQALARAGRALDDTRYAKGASSVYRSLVSDATAVRSGGQVRRFAMYSFRKSMRVLNGEIQTLVGLSDYARLSGSDDARRVVARASRGLVAQLGAWDTGAWTLYNTGGREATLHYHRLAAQFAGRACDQRLAKGFCPAARRFSRYTTEKPRLQLAVDERVRAPRRVAVAVRSSKLTEGALVVRGPANYRVRYPLTLGRGTTVVRFPVRREGRFRLILSGTAVNGKSDVERALVRVTPSREELRRRLRVQRKRERAAERREAARRKAARRKASDRPDA
jgi:hypothetical protein